MTWRLVILFILIPLVGCDGSPPKGKGWKVVGQLSDGLKARFVEVVPEKAKDHATYEDAVKTLCKSEEICVIGFFLPGDRVPVTQSDNQFFGNGGWRDYPALAIWWSTLANFTKWDCERAGAQGAPLDALCGPGIREAYIAILAVAGRAGMAEACQWPMTDGPAVAASYIASIGDLRRKEQYQNSYEEIYTSARKGPDQPIDCKRLRSKIEEAARQARSTLKAPNH